MDRKFEHDPKFLKSLLYNLGFSERPINKEYDHRSENIANLIIWSLGLFGVAGLYYLLKPYLK